MLEIFRNVRNFVKFLISKCELFVKFFTRTSVFLKFLRTNVQFFLENFSFFREMLTFFGKMCTFCGILREIWVNMADLAGYWPFSPVCMGGSMGPVL